KLKKRLLLQNLRSARRGAAAGPSGVTADHLKVILKDEKLCDDSAHSCEELIDSEVREGSLAAMRLGRFTILRKPNGGVRGIAPACIRMAAGPPPLWECRTGSR
ncbi:MAG: hypothetical protein VYD00_07535, partial [Pseudomonadota bacterium]|nr:hypothetical protein [Pseudomonadota bacterium]